MWPIDFISEIHIVLPGNTILAWFPSLDDVEDSVRKTRQRVVQPDRFFIDFLASLSESLEMFAVELPSSSMVFSICPPCIYGVIVPLLVWFIPLDSTFVLVSFSSLLRGVVGHPIRVTLDSELLCIPLKVCLRRSRVEGHRRGNGGGRRLAGGSRGS